MSLPVLQACIAGYSDRLFDQQLLAVHSGFWSGYYSSSKKPKPLASILEKLHSKRKKSMDTKKSTHANDVDVEAFLDMERRFKERLQRSKSEGK